MMKNFPDLNKKMHRFFFAARNNPNNLECFCDFFLCRKIENEVRSPSLIYLFMEFITTLTGHLNVNDIEGILGIRNRHPFSIMEK